MAPMKDLPSEALFASFHPAVAAWFTATFAAPTPPQVAAWPAIKAGQNVLIAAPTGSGKTLSAFFACIDDLIQDSLNGTLETQTRVLYVSPLKALSTDIRKNLELPLAGISERLEADGELFTPVAAAARTGDTSQSERDKMRRQPPHILVTTPESLYILLTSESGRRMLSGVRSVIVDEIHAMAGSKRGAHLLLSLARLDALTEQTDGSVAKRIGLSATQKPIDAMARYLCGQRDCTVVDTGHVRERDLALMVPSSPLTAVMANEVWTEIYDQLEALVTEHSTTLIFVNTRRLAERVTKHLAERIGGDAVTAHHGSLAKEHRLEAEQQLKAGQLHALVATASLELGIDIGDVDLVCQLGSPRSIAAFLQRVGRSGHAVGETPKGRLFPLSLDDLVECSALIDSVARDELDQIVVPVAPLDVLAQQVVAEVAGQEWDERRLYERFSATHSYRELSFDTFAHVTRMLAEGFATQRGRRGAYLYRDGVNGKLRARKSARLTALMNGGTIPDQFDYEVVLRPQDLRIGTLNEDFAFESLPGDIFQLGNSSYQILKVETGRVYVQDAGDMPPTIPFWFGEAPGRSDELSAAVSRLRDTMQHKLAEGVDVAQRWLIQELMLPTAAADQLTEHLGKALSALGVLPTHRTLVLERFFDETGDMHLVVHSTYGSRINRAMGLGLRKRFCKKFNFELQAAALEDSLVLSLGPTHSFAMDEVMNWIRSASVRDVVIQALLDAPMFETRWRWVATTSLAVKRMVGGGRRPPQFQRNDAEDLVAICFPDQIACQENVSGPREIPDHPLVTQAIADCLHEVMDIGGLERLLQALETNEVAVECRELTEPSPLSESIINARPYSFLDDGEAEERRTRAISTRSNLSWEEAASLGRLDPQVIAEVSQQAWIAASDLDEMHDGLLIAGVITAHEVQQNPAWAELLAQLAADGRAMEVQPTVADGIRWFATERWHEAVAVYDLGEATANVDSVSDPHGALVSLLRSRLEVVGPVTAAQLATVLAVTPSDVEVALLALEQEGVAVRGQFIEVDGSDSASTAVQWCNRRLLARIHRSTLKQRRTRFKPVDPASYLRFALDWHDMLRPEGEGRAALDSVLSQLEGWSAPVAVWEGELLPARLEKYQPSDLEDLCSAGRYSWLRLMAPDGGKFDAHSLIATPISLIPRRQLTHWLQPAVTLQISSASNAALSMLQKHGALFASDIQTELSLPDDQIETVLQELVAVGAVSSDNFWGARHVAARSKVRASREKHRRRGRSVVGVDDGGRWSHIARDCSVDERWQKVETVARALIQRYGVVFRAVIEREQAMPPWRDLLYVLRRMEARDELRGGRFVDGFAGEQFAHPEAATSLSRLKRLGSQSERVTVVSAYDPLNLVGVLTPGERIAAHAGHKVAFVQGVPTAALVAGQIKSLTDQALTRKVIEALEPAQRFSRRR